MRVAYMDGISAGPRRCRRPVSASPRGELILRSRESPLAGRIVNGGSCCRFYCAARGVHVVRGAASRVQFYGGGPGGCIRGEPCEECFGGGRLESGNAAVRAARCAGRARGLSCGSSVAERERESERETGLLRVVGGRPKDGLFGHRCVSGGTDCAGVLLCRGCVGALIC